MLTPKRVYPRDIAALEKPSDTISLEGRGLSFEPDEFTKEVIPRFEKYYPDGAHIYSLNLTDCGLGDERILALAAVIKKKRFEVRYLDVEGNDLTGKSLLVLANNPHIQELNITRNGMMTAEDGYKFAACTEQQFIRVDYMMHWSSHDGNIKEKIQQRTRENSRRARQQEQQTRTDLFKPNPAFAVSENSHPAEEAVPKSGL